MKKGFDTLTAEEYRNLKKKKRRRPQSGSEEATRQRFISECQDRGLPTPIPEYKPFLHIGRKHATDFYFDFRGSRLALEVEGWGHKTTERYNADLFKYNHLTLNRIFLLRVKPKNLFSEDTFNMLSQFFSQ